MWPERLRSGMLCGLSDCAAANYVDLALALRPVMWPVKTARATASIDACAERERSGQ